MKAEKKIRVIITTDSTQFWYKKDEVHEVRNRVVFTWKQNRGQPYFEKQKGYYGIPLEHCEVLPKPQKK